MNRAWSQFEAHYRQLGRALLVDIAEKVGMPIELAEARAGQIDREMEGKAQCLTERR